MLRVSAQDSTAAASGTTGLKSKVIYSARDSVRFDVQNQKVFLFGEGDVKYENMTLVANYIEFDMTKNVAYARGARDSSGNIVLDSAGMPIGDPVFSEGAKSFDAKEITYNFETKKGKIKEVTTQEGEAFIHAKDAKKDSNEVYFIKNGKYTTCNLDHPHFYLNATKIKIIPNDKIIFGPAYLAVGDAPTPLVLPFGIFPNKSGRKSGVLIPSYGESALGFFLKDGGYYFGISDYFDLALRGDFYSRGSIGLKTNTNYCKRYKYRGSLGLNGVRLVLGQKELPKTYSERNDFFINWQHSQDPKSNPTLQFSANVRAGSSTYQTYNSNTANDYLANTLQSTISLNKSWPGRPYNFSMFASHNQNTINRSVDITLPELAFSRNRAYPFRRKILLGKPRWYEKVGISVSTNAKNEISTSDTLLFKKDALQKFRNGMKATIPISTSMNIGPFILTPSANLNNYGYFQSYKKRYDEINDSLITDTLNEFKYAYDYNASLALNTKLYGMFSFKNARVKAIRHVIAPSASFSIRPDFSHEKYKFYYYLDTSATAEPILYSIFQNGVYGSPPYGKSGYLNLALNNNLEMKLRPAKNDSSEQDRKVMLIENFSISSSYNLAAETFQWSPISLNARTQVFKTVDINLIGIIDQYAYDTLLKRRIDRFEYNVTKKLGRLTSASLSIRTSLRSLTKKKDETIKPSTGKRPDSYYDELNYIQRHPDYYVDFNVPWDLSVDYNIVYARPGIQDTIIQTLAFSGNVNITEKWKVGFHSGFDFVKKDFTYTSFNIYRDLHCWEMRLDWIPFGFRKSYMLTVTVKASTLQDLKLNKKRDWYDTH